MNPYDLADYGSQFGEEFGEEFGADFGAVGAPSLDGVVVGIPLITIPIGGGQQTTAINVTKPFRCERLILIPTGAAADVALSFVQQISISSEEQNISNNPVPTQLFTADATHRLRGTIVTPGVGINLTTLGLAGIAAAVTVTGAFFGPAMAR